MPEGTPVLFAGGRQSFATEAEARALADNVWTTLDRVRHRPVVLPDERAEDLRVDARAQGRRAGEIEEDDGDAPSLAGLPSAGQLVGAAVAEPGRVAVRPTAPRPSEAT